MIDLFFVLVLYISSESMSIPSSMKEREEVGEKTYSIGIRFRNTFRNDFLITILMTSILAILTLHSRSLQQELST